MRNRPIAHDEELAERSKIPVKESLKLLLPYLARYWRNIGIALLCLILAKLATVAVPVLLKFIVDTLDNKGQLATAITVPTALIIGYGMLRLMTTIFTELRNILFAKISQQIIRQLTLRVFRHLHQLPLAFHLSRKTGMLTRDVERGSKSIALLLRYVIFQIVPTIVEIVAILVIYFVAYGWQIVLVTVAAIVCYVIFTVLVTNWRTKFRWQMNQQDSLAGQQLIESLMNYETVKYFGNEMMEQERYNQTMKDWQQSSIKTMLSLSFLNIGQGLIVVVALTLILLIAANQVSLGQITLGDFVLVNTLLLQLYFPLGFLGTIFREIQQSLIDLSKLVDLLAVKVNANEREGGRVPEHAAVTGDVVFDKVYFQYDNRPILQGVSFVAKAGKQTAIVGASGAGKSTLFRLLFRFYTPDSGQILLGNENIQTFDINALRRHIGVVPQDTVLFNDSIAYNIGYAKPGATASEIRAVAKLAYLDEFIEKLPNKYDTLVGERGFKLSGGEKQRLAIARMLLKNPQLLILDEATSSLDSVSEQHIQAALRALMQGRTTLTIAHRLSTIIHSDEIIVLENGVVAERGTHAELLAKKGVYAELWEVQLLANDNISSDLVSAD